MIVKVIPQRKASDNEETVQNEIYLTIAPEFVQEQALGMSM